MQIYFLDDLDYGVYIGDLKKSQENDDGVSRERRRSVEPRGDEEIERASREISAVRFEVDNLAKQVSFFMHIFRHCCLV